MLALRLHPGGALRLHQEAEPSPAAGEALVRVAAVGLCGSDRHWLLEGSIGDAVVDEALVLGHEFAGVAETGQYRDRLVAGDPTITCERCPPCRSGAPNLCLNQRFAGYSGTDGALRELIAWPERLLYPLADRVDAAEGAIVEPLAVAAHAVELAGEVEGATVGVVGCGPIGLLIVSLAREAGATTILATDPLPHRLAAALERGATAVELDGDRAGLGLDVVFEVAGEDEAVDAAIQLARPGGQLILVGIPAHDRTSFQASVARRKGLTMRLTRRSTPRTFEQAVQLADQGAFDLSSLVSLRVPLAEAGRAFDALAAREGMKVLVEPGGALA
jgi:L-iditol 2-dehydrogenase